MNLIEYPDRDTQTRSLADTLATALATALSQKPRVTFAVPGGTTPGPVFEALSTCDLEWSRVHVLLTDERWVPETDAASNAALIRTRLLTDKAASAPFTPYYRSDSQIEAAASALSEALAPQLPIDVLLLGMGADMHTASLFPEAPGLRAALSPDAPMFLPVHVAGQANARLTLSAPALQSARAIHLLITGAEKRNAVMQASSRTTARAPVNCILPQSTVHWSA